MPTEVMNPPNVLLPSWENSILQIILYGVGVLIVMSILLRIVLQLTRSKHSESAYIVGLGIAFALLIFLGLLDLFFDVAALSSWANAFIVAANWIVGSTVLIWIAWKITQQVEKHNTIYKPGIWILAFAWLCTLGGIFVVTIKSFADMALQGK